MAVDAPAKRAILIGLDGAGMDFVKRMADEGHIPNIARLISQGVYKGMVGVFPTMTATGWTTLSTGAWPSTHGVMDFSFYQPGRGLDRPMSSSPFTETCRAEYLWNTAERAGKVPILVKWEISWPPTVTTGVQVEGGGPGAHPLQISGYHLFVAGPSVREEHKEESEERLRELAFVAPYYVLDDPSITDPVEIRPADTGAWNNLPQSSRPYLEVALAIRPLARGNRGGGAQGKVGEPKNLYALLYASGGDGYDRARITRSRDAGQVVTELKVGQWSDWILDSFRIDGAEIQGNVRFKLIRLSPEGDVFDLYLPQIWPLTGYTQPPEIAQEIYENVGPFLQHVMAYNTGNKLAPLVIDDETHFEILEYHHQHLADVARYLTSTRTWDLLFLEIHTPDHDNHRFINQADPIYGEPPEVVERFYNVFVRSWQSIDRMFGKLMELMDDETVVVVVSDHGATPNQHGRINVDDVLEKAGLLVYEDGPATTGRRAIDWSRTKAKQVTFNGVICVNLKGREPNGIVEPEEYEAVQTEIVAALFEYKEPRSGLHPFTLALRKQDAEILNLGGENTADVVFTLHPAFNEAHGPELSTSKLGIGDQHPTFIMSGAGVRKGVHLSRQVRQVDMAPTVAYLLGMPMPRDAEGAIVYEALEDPDWQLHALERLSGA